MWTTTETTHYAPVNSTSLCFDDILLIPQFSDIESRKEVDVSPLSESLFSGYPKLSLPIIASPMDTVVNAQVAVEMAKLGGFAILHRYNSIEEQCEELESAFILGEHVDNPTMNIGCAIGATGDYLERAQALWNQGCRIFCIDVAHGHHQHVKNALLEMRKKFGKDVHLMTGNVSTLEAFNDLADWGADSIRLGCGGGSSCKTRIVTGHGLPTLQTIIDCSYSNRDALIIADGGIRTSGDIVKALACGAHFVMLGSLLAGHNESPGETFVDPVSGVPSKKFRGMASAEAQMDWRGKVSGEEGVSWRVPVKGAISSTIERLVSGLKSGCSYSGARTLSDLRAKAVYSVVSANSIAESKPHILGA